MDEIFYNKIFSFGLDPNSKGVERPLYATDGSLLDEYDRKAGIIF